MKCKVTLIHNDGTVENLGLDYDKISNISVIVKNQKYFMYQSQGGRFFSDITFIEILPPLSI